MNKFNNKLSKLALLSSILAGASYVLVACGGSGSTATTASTTSTSTNTTTTTTTPTSSDCSTVTAQSAKLVCLANNFRASLSSTELTSVTYALTASNATSRWSNLPVDLVARNGIALNKLSTTSKAAAESLISAALTSQGTTTMTQLRIADGYLGTMANGYGKDLYYVAFLGDPSNASPWILQFTGHHYTIHISVTGSTISATPMFVGVEPTNWTADGTTYEPMKPHRDSLLAMLTGLTSTQLAAAKLGQAYDDLLVPPQADGKFPSTRSGVLVSSLNVSQQALVIAAITAYAGDANGTDQLTSYLSSAALSDTYIAWASYADLSTKGSYVRIDGPRAWIEFSVQNGIVIRDKNHFHSILRDKTMDYGGNFKF